MVFGGIALGGILLSSYCTSMWAFIWFYAALSGLGQGSMYMLPMVCGWEYFPNRKGLVTGITVGAYGFSSFVFNPIITMMINPNNREAKIIVNHDLTFFEEDIAKRVPGTIRTLALIWTFLVVFSALLISRPSSEKLDGST